jgi:prepilin signal peptidase PulO-like enzyme (type II secretory pathway)
MTNHLQFVWTAAMLILSFAAGSVLGSAFLCYLDRRDRKEKWTKGRSCCTACGHPLEAKDLVPVISYLSLHGRCRYCGEAYPAATIFCELAMGFSGVFAFLNVLLFGEQYGKFVCLYVLLYVLLGLGAVNDIYNHECEYVIQYGVCAIGLFLQYKSGGIGGVIACGIVGVVVYLIGVLVLRAKNKGKGTSENVTTDNAIGIADIIVMTGTVGMVGYRYCAIVWLYASLCTLVFFAVLHARHLDCAMHPNEQQVGIGYLPGAMFGAFFAQVAIHAMQI